MDSLISKANFVHDNEEEHDKFKDKLSDWYSENEEKCSAADGLKVIKALGVALTGKKFPSHETEGWKQAITAFEHVLKMTDDLKESGKLKERDLQDAYYSFIIQISSANNIASIQMQVFKDVVRDRDIEFEDYIKTLPIEKVKSLFEICKRKPIEEPGKNEDIFEKFYYAIRELADALTSEQAQELQSYLLECALHLLLSFTHLENDSLEHVADASNRLLSVLERPWEKTTDFALAKQCISKLNDYFKGSPVVPEKLHRPIREFIRDMRTCLAKRGLVEEFAFDFHDLAMTIAKSKMEFNDFTKDCFNYSIMFFKDIPEASLKKNSGSFIDFVSKFNEGMNQTRVEFAEYYVLRVTEALVKMYPKNKQHVEQWFQLLLPLLKLPFVDAMDAANEVVDAPKGLEWKGKSDLAEKVFKAAESVQIPEFTDETDEKRRLDKRERFVKYYKYFLKNFMEGLTRAKMASNFGIQALRLCSNLLKVSGDFEELKELVEDVSEKIEINVKDAESKKAMVQTMKAITEACQNPDFPWVDDWHFERAVKELVRACVRAVSDPRVLTDADLVTYIAVCEEALTHDVLDPETGQFSSQHYTVFMETMGGLTDWLKALDKYNLAGKLFDQIMTTYETEEPTVFALNSRYLSDASQVTTGTKMLSPHIDKLFELLIETENANLVQTLMQVYPANPKSIGKHMPALMQVFMNCYDDSTVSSFAMMLHSAVKCAPEVFDKQNTKQILDKSAQNQSWQPSTMQIIQELCKRRPELMVGHISILMDKTKWQGMLSSWINDMIGTLALYDEKLAPKALDYMLEEAGSDTEKHNLLTALNSARQIGFKYRDLMKARRDKVEQLQFNDPDAQNLKQITLDMIDGKTSEEMVKQFEEQQANIAGLVGRVDEIEEDMAEMKSEVDRQGQDLNTVKKDVNLHGHRLDQVEETVEETVAKVEEIDQKTLSHSPYWSRDVAKLLNPKSDHDWRLLSSRLGYSNDDIRAWAQQADPCMAMLNEWYATRKTSEATLAILTQLQEMNRQDAAVIVENAMKNAEAVVEDEDFEYASPPPIFISYQWGHQPEARLLQKHLEMAGYQCWLDLGQMGGGDKLFEKIDSGIRAAKVVISCVTEKYAKSPNCNREVNLSVSLNKVMIPLLMEKCTWPPPGSMGPIFSEYLFIRFFQRGGEELPDERYWPKDKFQELLMQLDVMGLPPDATQIEPVYKDWWMPKVQEIKIDKSKTKDGGKGPKVDTTELDKKAAVSPDVFISYQWGKQKNIIQLYERLTGLGLTCWLDIKQMGGGDSLYDKIDRGVRGCRVVVSCVTQKYALSPNCRREVSLADALKKPLVPLLLESMQWPPTGPMSMAFTQLLYIDFAKDESEQLTWNGVKSQELIDKLNEHVPVIDHPKNDKGGNSVSNDTGGHLENADKIRSQARSSEGRAVEQKVQEPEVKKTSEEPKSNNKSKNYEHGINTKMEHENSKSSLPEVKKTSEETKSNIKSKNDEHSINTKMEHENSKSSLPVPANELIHNKTDHEISITVEKQGNKKETNRVKPIKAEHFTQANKAKVAEKQVSEGAYKKNKGPIKPKESEKKSSDQENLKNVNLKDKPVHGYVGAKRVGKDLKERENSYTKEREQRKLELRREDEKEHYKRKWEDEKEKLFKQQELQKEEERKFDVEKRRLERRKELEKQQKEKEIEEKNEDFNSEAGGKKHNALPKSSNKNALALSKLNSEPPKQEKQKTPRPPPSQLAAVKLKERNYPPYSSAITAFEESTKPQNKFKENKSTNISQEDKPKSIVQQNTGTSKGVPLTQSETDRNTQGGHLKSSDLSNVTENPQKRSPRPPPSQQAKKSEFNPFSPAFRKASKPKKAAQEKPAATAKQPQRAEPKPEAAQQPKKVEPKPTAAEQPEKVEPKPAAAQQPEKVEPKPAAAQQPEKVEPKPAAAQQPKKVEPKPTAAQQPEKVEPKPAAAQQPEKAEQKPVAAQQPEKAEPKPAATQQQTSPAKPEENPKKSKACAIL